MRKSTVIANYLVSKGHIMQLSDAEFIAEQLFNDAFPDVSFDSWNTPINSTSVEVIMERLDLSASMTFNQIIKKLEEL